ncbi:MAG TPA: FdrA family protein [Clostridiales bacterium UBA8960]|nr:FdrA family protein [Clostridiales bacterium UBA8960]
MVLYEIRKNAYYDSVTLMLISKEIKALDGVTEVLVGMATELNKELAGNLSLGSETLDELSPNDFFIAADVENSEVMDLVVETVNTLLTQKKANTDSVYRPVTIKAALEMVPDANMAVVSVAGQYAEDEVDRLLDENIHVMLFSDNVSVAAEKRLKEKAVEKGLLMMGPDCGTAIINGIPLAFANVVSRGPIGIIGASGTGTQEVSTLIDQLGSGCSQVIGTGGRDLKSEIGGLMMLQSMDALIADPETKVIVLISKPPSPEVAEKILKKVKETDKPVVVDFIGGDLTMIRNSGAVPCLTLEDTAYKAVALANGKAPEDFLGFELSDAEIDALVKTSVAKLKPEQKFLRGLYTGGTLADEAMKLLGPSMGAIYSNIPLQPEYMMDNLDVKGKHTCLDLGEDQFTVGRPHPMIDPSTRTERMLKDIDDTVAVALLDVVIGYGSHENPAGEVAQAIQTLNKTLKNEVIYVASITGTSKDPQDMAASKADLESVGVIVMPSNAQAVRLTGKLMAEIG